MIKKIFKDNLVYIILMFLFLIFCLIMKYNFSDLVLKLDNNVMNFFQNKIVNNANTSLMKYITYFGDVVAFVFIIIFAFILNKTRKYSFPMTINLVWVYFISVILKNIFMRSRPMISLISKPKDYSFPSGHTMCSLAFYGFFAYILVTNVKNVFVKWLITFCFSMLVIFIGISRIYLNVHYFSDVIGGAIFGIICLLMFINIYRKNLVD